MRQRVCAAVAAALVLGAAGFTAGCAEDRGPAAAPSVTSPAATPSAASPATPSGYAEMEKKVAAAESAVGQADKDAAEDTGR
ncbi:hypothetical protein [Streptomyces sp. NPDC046805]|uniref:hypothetical protein n=1 Tax=Streptomyces sp. NPDC046805 TaxID=3155134 RepID=UPI0033EAF33B